MSTKLPFFKLFPNDYLMRIRNLSNEEVGIYTLIVLQMWDSGPMSPEAIESYVGEVPKKVLVRFPVNGGGNHFCDWLEDMRDKADKAHKANVEFGKQGAASRWGSSDADAHSHS
jgi:hypothetical protein